MENLQKYITEHEEEFNSSVPLPGHINRFENKLAAHENLKDARRFSVVAGYLKIAAVVVVLLSFGALLYAVIVPGKVKDSASFSNSPEIKEIEQYYMLATSSKLNKIEQLTVQDRLSVQAKNEIIEQIDLIQSESENIKKKINSGLGNERLVDALKNNYRIINNLLDHILVQIETQGNATKNTSVNPQKQSNHEIIYS